ncbi:hypothetical protein GC169_11620 [bacterium]|nr:hypothetical protein [bacterium]
MTLENVPESSRDGPVRLANESVFSLGPVRVDPTMRSFGKPGFKRSVEPRAMQVLVALVQARGAVVSRDVLVARCWDGRVVGDDAIYRVISQLRDLATGFAAGSFNIETIPKIGYRLVTEASLETGDTSALDADATGKPLEFDPAAEAPPKSIPPLKWTRRAIVGGALAVGAVALILPRSNVNGTTFKDLIAQGENAERMDMPDSNAKGVGFLEEAVALEPSNPLGWGRLALALTYAAEYVTADRASGIVSRAQEAAARALSLNADQPDARAALAILPPYFGEWQAAEDRMQVVVASNPDHLQARDAHDFLLSGIGRMREASHSRIAYAKQVPLHARFQYRVIYAYWNLGMIAHADRAADRALQLWPLHPGVWFARLWTLAFSDRAEQALAQAEVASRRPDLPDQFVQVLQLSLRALLSRTARDTEAATDAILAGLKTSPSAAIHAIMILNAFGDIDGAFAVARAYLLEQGPLIAEVRWREGQISINDQRRRKTHMLFVPISAPMRKDTRFAYLMEDVGLADYWGAANVIPDHLIEA